MGTLTTLLSGSKSRYVANSGKVIVDWVLANSGGKPHNKAKRNERIMTHGEVNRRELRGLAGEIR